MKGGSTTTTTRKPNKSRLTLKSNLPPLIPKENVPITLKQLKDSIPAHCFERSLVRSFSHLFLDLLETVIWFCAITYLDSKLAANPSLFTTTLSWICWTIYWVYQGITWTGLWVLGHECGHGGFSDYQWLNDIVGFVLHTVMLVPYFSWQFSHAKHHHYTNHMLLDEVFVPEKHENQKKKMALSTTEIQNSFFLFVQLVGVLVIGWPLYLAFNASGPPKQRLTCHYDPVAPIFKRKDWWKIVLSDLGLVGWLATLYFLFNTYGWIVVKLYWPALLVTNAFLVSITFLQHTDEKLAHFDSSEWTWLRGALSTVDRSLGGFVDYKTHYIVSSHVAHHIFSYMPFYHAEEASKHIVPLLGEYYIPGYKTGFFGFAKALWQNMGSCGEVSGDKGILYYFLSH